MFGTKWTNAMELCFYEDLLRIIIEKNNAATVILRKHKSGEKDAGQTDIYDYEEYLKARKELDNATQEEKKKLLKKYNTGKLPSDVLFKMFEEDSNEE